MDKQLTDEQKTCLKSVVTHFDKEDVSVRERQILSWRKLKLMWEGLNNIYFDSVAHDWRVYDAMTSGESGDQAYYDKRVNIFRAYLESIFAALSVVVPPIKCYPDDAEDTLDMSTARAGDRIAKLIYRHNDAPLLWLHMLFIFGTEGMVAVHNYVREDAEYGTYKKKQYEDTNEEHEVSSCPNCGFELSSNQVEPTESNNTIEQPPSIEDDNVDAQINSPHGIPGVTGQAETEEDMMRELEILHGIDADEFMPGELTDDCPSCGNMIAPQMERKTVKVTRLVGETDEPKSRVCMDAYGGLYVKVPNYARKQKDMPYLILEYETNYVNAVEQFEDLKGSAKQKEFAKEIKDNAGQISNDYEQWGRLSPQYRGEYPLNVVTVRYAWLRPCAFNILDKDERDELNKLFPNGVKVTLINDEFGDACEEVLDDHWTLIQNPLSDYVHFDPMGTSLVSIQEITNDLISLVIQTIEHGIGQTFADPSVLNFKAYEQTEATPGGVFPATPKGGKTLNEAFHEMKTATLSQEVLPFMNNVQSLGQLASGALPSLFGGMMQGGGETASEYSMSRAQALQRLQNNWKMFTTLWKTTMAKCITMFIKIMVDDEREVMRKPDGSFINVFIRKAESEGKIGKVELEANENLPITWSQQKDIIMKLLESQNPLIQQFIMAPENLDIIRDAIGLTDFFVPGEEDREKQYDEIKLLVNTKPTPNPMMADPNAMMQAMTIGQPMEQEVSSIPIEPEVDNHVVQYEICRHWLISEAGRQAKIDNPDGYKNVLLHAKEHLMAIPPPPMPASDGNGAVPSEKPGKGSLKNAPINGEENVATVN